MSNNQLFIYLVASRERGETYSSISSSLRLNVQEDDLEIKGFERYVTNDNRTLEMFKAFKESKMSRQRNKVSRKNKGAACLGLKCPRMSPGRSWSLVANSPLEMLVT